MPFLNYHHLRYLWVVAREGTLRKASEVLRISQPAISIQLQVLQTNLGEELFRRSGRNLVLTEMGQLVYGFAEEIFAIGEDLMGALGAGLGPVRRQFKLNVGLADSVPKLVAYEILKPAFAGVSSVQVLCREGKTDDLLAQLATMRLDIVLADEPASTSLKFKMFNHLLGSCGVTFCAAPALARQLRRGFPQSLHGAPALLPTQNTNLRRSLEGWFRATGIQPRIVGEFEDAAMLSVVGADGHGFLPMASVIGKEALTRYQLEVIGATDKCRDQYYAITAERRLTHPAVLLVTNNAKLRLFPKRKRK